MIFSLVAPATICQSAAGPVSAQTKCPEILIVAAAFVGPQMPSKSWWYTNVVYALYIYLYCIYIYVQIGVIYVKSWQTNNLYIFVHVYIYMYIYILYIYVYTHVYTTYIQSYTNFVTAPSDFYFVVTFAARRHPRWDTWNQLDGFLSASIVPIINGILHGLWVINKINDIYKCCASILWMFINGFI